MHMHVWFIGFIYKMYYKLHILQVTHNKENVSVVYVIDKNLLPRKLILFVIANHFVHALTCVPITYGTRRSAC